MMKRVDIRPIQRDPILRAELKARYWGGRVEELSLGDVLLAGPRAVALLEFKREANWEGRWKEHSKLLKIEAVLEHPKFENLRDTSKQIHFYVETSDILEEGFKSRVLPYLELRTDDRRSNLEQLIDNLAFRARSAPALTEMDRNACQRYLKLVCRCQGSKGRSYHTPPASWWGWMGTAASALRQ